MATYAVQLQRTASTTASLGTWVADATRPRRLKFHYIVFGSEGTVADNPFNYQVQRCTAAGTSTAVTPQPLDPADAATESDAGQAHTVEPTYTASAILLSLSINQRATAQWYGRPGKEIITPATASNGIGIKTPTAGAVAITATLHADEQ